MRCLASLGLRVTVLVTVTSLAGCAATSGTVSSDAQRLLETKAFELLRSPATGFGRRKTEILSSEEWGAVEKLSTWTIVDFDRVPRGSHVIVPTAGPAFTVPGRERRVVAAAVSRDLVIVLLDADTSGANVDAVIVDRPTRSLCVYHRAAASPARTASKSDREVESDLAVDNPADNRRLAAATRRALEQLHVGRGGGECRALHQG